MLQPHDLISSYAGNWVTWFEKAANRGGCLRGISIGDFREALSAILGADAPNLSPGVISRLTGEWQQEYDRWQHRDLSARRNVYIWADGVYLQAWMEPQAECILVILGGTLEGKREVVGFQVGVRESAQSWRELLIDIKVRGLAVPPEIAVGDGAMGFWKALDEVFPGTRHQRCWVHNTANVLNKFPKSMQPTVKADLREIWQADSGPREIDLVVLCYGRIGPGVVPAPKRIPFMIDEKI
jgi:transposase-like protein